MAGAARAGKQRDPMSFEARTLRDFYRTPLGRAVRQRISPIIRQRWPNTAGMTLVGAGFATPYLAAFRGHASRLACLMPARQGALVWPKAGKCHSVLVGEANWPLPDNSVDRLLAVHCLEQAERIGPLLREMWRVLKPEGRMLLIVPNRRGLWSRVDSTPFGQGLPFSRGQLQEQLTDALFMPAHWSEALFFPPLDRRLLLRAAPALERFGNAVSFGVAGVIVVEASKELMTPVGSGARAGAGIVLKPAEPTIRTRRQPLGVPRALPEKWEPVFRQEARTRSRSRAATETRPSRRAYSASRATSGSGAGGRER